MTGAILAVAVGLLTHRLLAADALSAALVGGLVFLIFMHFLASADWRAERRSMEHRMMALHADYQDALGGMDDLRDEMEGLRRSVAEDNRASGAELVSELKVLQTLLSQVAGKSARPAEARLSNRPLHTANEHALAHGAAAGAAAASVQQADILDIMHHALEENRIDLYLQPVVRLPSRKTVYYEAFSRVRDEHGQVIFPRQFLPVVEESGLIGTLDNLLLFRCIQLIRRLGARRPGVKFFCNISSMSLEDGDFFPQFIDFMSNNADLKDRLVFEFAQEDAQNHSPEVFRGLAILGRRGFRFSLDQVRDLNLDPALLASRQFSYVKASADVFRQGQGQVHRGDLQAVLARQDIDLIVDMIEDEETVIDILDHGVEYGQGFLFGEPRPSRDDLGDAPPAADS